MLILGIFYAFKIGQNSWEIWEWNWSGLECPIIYYCCYPLLSIFTKSPTLFEPNYFIITNSETHFKVLASCFATFEEIDAEVDNYGETVWLHINRTKNSCVMVERLLGNFLALSNNQIFHNVKEKGYIVVL